MSGKKKQLAKQNTSRVNQVNGKHNISNGLKHRYKNSLDNPDDLVCSRKYYNELSLLFGSVSLAVYLVTIYPSLPGGDSGELIVAAHELGVAHPPGYPLYTLVSWLFIKLLPFGNVAWRVSIQTAFCAGISTYCLSMVVLRLTDSLPCVVFAVGVWSWSRLTWIWSVTAEVFAMNNLFVAMLMYLGVYFEDQHGKDKAKVAMLGSFVCGLSLCNQHTMVVYVLCLAVWILSQLKNQEILDTYLLLKIGLCFIAGLVPYIYIPLSSLFFKSRWTWGDQTTVTGFITHLLRSEYGTFDLGKDQTGQGLSHGLRLYIQHVIKDLTLLTAPLFVIGSITLIYRAVYKQTKRWSLVVYLFMLILYIVFFSWRANLDLDNPLFFGVVERFWMQSDIVIVVIATAALCDIFEWLKSRVQAIEKFHLEILFTIFLAVYQLQRNYLTCDQSRNTVVYDFGKEILQSMPPDAIVLTKGDLPSNVLRYLYLCEDVRNDLQIFDQEVLTYEWAVPMLSGASPKIKFPGDYLHPRNTLMADGKRSFNFKKFLDVNYDKYPIYGCIGGQDHDTSWKTSYELLPFGPCYQFIKKGMLLNVPIYVNQTIQIARNWKYPYEGFDKTSWERVATNEMWNAQISSGYYLYEVAEISQNKDDKSNFVINSYKLYTSAIERHKTVPSHWHKNYALVCERMLRANHDMDKSKLLSKSVYHFEKFLELEPNDPDSQGIRDAIEMLKKHIRLLQQKI